jgi:acyl-CoA synthetase (AMP-forming)/AMP-acid ligase II
MNLESWLVRNPDANIVALLSERAAQHPERLALTYLRDGDGAEERFTYAELHERAAGIASELQQRGGPGERALLLYRSGASYASAFLGCLYAGWVAVPAYPPESLDARHVARVLGIAKDSRPRLVLTEQALSAPLRAVQGSHPLLASIQILATDGLDPAQRGDYRAPALAHGAPAFLQYTSGSTADPKGVVVGHDNLMANERVVRDAFAMQDDDVVVSWLPLFHDMGLVGALLQPLYSGVSLVLMGPQHFIERPMRWLEAISRHGGTVSGAPDFAYRLCAERARTGLPSGLDLGRWRLAFCGAEPVRAATLEAFADRFAPARFERRALYPCYGLAEATLLATGGERGGGVLVRSFEAAALARNVARESERGAALVACGRPRHEHRLAIVDVDSGAPVAPGGVGEIQLSGPSVSRGYWEKPELNAETFVERGGLRFLRTGDLGFEHEGQIYITGRHKDVILIRGQNLYPQDLERSVEEHVEVVRKGRCVAFAIDLGGLERVGVAAEVSPRARAWIEPAEVCRAISEAIGQEHGEAAQLVLLVNAGSLPITSSGKLQRAATRRGWLGGTLDVFAVWESGELRRSSASPSNVPVVR